MPPQVLYLAYRKTQSLWSKVGLLLVLSPVLVFPNFWPLLTAVSLSLLLLLFFLRPLKPSPFNGVWLAWWLMVLVAVLVTADPDLTLPKFTGLILGFAWWVYLSRAINGRSSLILAFIFWGLLGMGFAVIGVLSATWLFKVPGISAILQALPSQILQLPGSDSGVQPNQLAGTLLLYLPFLVSLLLGWRPAAHRRWLLAGTAVLTLITAALLILTQSRSGWIGAIGGLFVLLVLWGIVLPSMRQRKLIWAGVGASLLAGIGGLWAFGPQKLQTIWDDPGQLGATAVGNLGSLGFRQEVWRWGITAVQDFPFTGAGLGAFRHVVRRLYPLHVNPTYDIAHAHNIFLQTALDVGLPGLIVYLALLLLAFWLGWQVARGDETLRPFALGLLAGFAALHIYGLTDALALGSKTGLSFWVALGLLTAMHQIVRQTAVTQPPPVLPDAPTPAPDHPAPDPAALQPVHPG